MFPEVFKSDISARSRAYSTLVAVEYGPGGGEDVGRFPCLVLRGDIACGNVALHHCIS